ncbi:IPT/TIG domain-containing protein [Ralstonia pseudosolanacearum]|uniref:Hypothethical protein n=1 Tax=Ralstonia solanacearum TaxID=305 RepID=A0A0S4TUL0_RALSL
MTMTLVIVNSAIYGGSGGPVAVFSKAVGAEQIGIHEMAHTAFRLADEYSTYAGCSSGETGHDTYTGAEPTQANCEMRTLGQPFCAVCRCVISDTLTPFLPGPPVIDSFSPTSGDPAGGTIVVLTGHGFFSASAVNFGATPAVTFSVDSDTQITALSPPAPAA